MIASKWFLLSYFRCSIWHRLLNSKKVHNEYMILDDDDGNIDKDKPVGILRLVSIFLCYNN